MERIDLKGKVCPFVLFHTKKKLETIKRDSELEVILDDPTAKETISGWCKAHGHRVIEIIEKEDHIVIIIKKC